MPQVSLTEKKDNERLLNAAFATELGMSKRRRPNLK